MTPHILRIILHYCVLFHMDPLLVRSVIQVESGWDVQRIGKAEERGLMQLLPSSFPKYTRDQLEIPEINLREGIKYLAQMKKECRYKSDNTWLICYNHGPTGSAKVQNPFKDIYYTQVMLTYKQLRKEADEQRKAFAL